MDLRSPVNMVTRYSIWPNLIFDRWFTEQAFLARVREKFLEFKGGSFIKTLYRKRPLPAGSYPMGATHDITKVDTLGESNHDVRFYQCSIPEYKEELQVYAKGEDAMFSLIDEDLENGLASISNVVGIDLYGNGQTNETGVNGFAEAIGDGVLPSWNGDVATSYLGIDRTSDSTANGHIYWFGTETGGLAPPTFRKLNRLYNLCSRGNIEPNLILMNKWAHGLCEEEIEPNYRYSQGEIDPYWGGRGFRFKNAIVLKDEYAPSLRNGKSDDDNYGLGNYLTGNIVNPLTGTPANEFPNSTDAPTLQVGEPIFMLNDEYWQFIMSDDPEYAFGFSGFIGAQDSEKVVGRIKFAGNFIGQGNQYQGVGYGIG